MKKPPTDDDDDEVRPYYRTSYGDIGVVLIAAGCTLAFLLMMILPSPRPSPSGKAAKAAQKPGKGPVQKAHARQGGIGPSGEVSARARRRERQ